MRPWILSELNYSHVRDQAPFDVAVLPLGATEPHNLHLPYGTDTIQVEAVAERACALAYERGARVVALPAIPFGTETNMMRFPLTMNLQPTTVARIITDLVDSLETHKIQKCVLLNGHGGNDLKWVLRELNLKTTVHLFLCNWYRVGADHHAEIFTKVGDHADELETSMILHLAPNLVELQKADPGTEAISRFDAVRHGWVQITRPWHLATTNTGVGDPRPATAQKGAALFELVVGRISDFLVDLAHSPIDEHFPY